MSKEQKLKIQTVGSAELEILWASYRAFTLGQNLPWHQGVPSDGQLPLPFKMEEIYRMINKTLRANNSFPRGDVTSIESWVTDPGTIGTVLRTSYEHDGFHEFPTKPIDLWFMPDDRIFLFQPEAFTSTKVTEIVLPRRK